MRILCLSDTHGELPELDLSDIDLVLHAGDYSHAEKYDFYRQITYYQNVFTPWLNRIDLQCPVYFISGNHEVFAEKVPPELFCNDMWKWCNIDEKTVRVSELNIYGFPWTNRFYDWAFNADDVPEDMGVKCSGIPEGTDILLTHGPVFGMRDRVKKGLFYEYHGSKQLLERVWKIRPKIVISGHLHDDGNYGIVEYEGIKFVGCSIMDESYTNSRPPIIVEI